MKSHFFLSCITKNHDELSYEYNMLFMIIKYCLSYNMQSSY